MVDATQDDDANSSGGHAKASPRSRYIVAIKREHLDVMPADWFEALRELVGVSLELPNESSGKAGTEAAPPPRSAHNATLKATTELRHVLRRVQVDATEEGVERIRVCLGNTCYVEPLIEHRQVESSSVDRLRKK